MSNDNWERGEFTLAASEYPKFRTAYRRAFNERQDVLLKEANRLWELGKSRIKVKDRNDYDKAYYFVRDFLSYALGDDGDTFYHIADVLLRGGKYSKPSRGRIPARKERETFIQFRGSTNLFC